MYILYYNCVPHSSGDRLPGLHRTLEYINSLSLSSCLTRWFPHMQNGAGNRFPKIVIELTQYC